MPNKNHDLKQGDFYRIFLESKSTFEEKLNQYKPDEQVAILRETISALTDLSKQRSFKKLPPSAEIGQEDPVKERIYKFRERMGQKEHSLNEQKAAVKALLTVFRDLLREVARTHQNTTTFQEWGRLPDRTW